METWDTGNFDNDGALDFVGDLIDQLARNIDECLADEAALLIDEECGVTIVPSVHIIALLSENCGAAPPQAHIVEEWKCKFLTIFDGQIREMEADEGFEEERRAVIATTFEKLEKQSRQFWSED